MLDRPLIVNADYESVLFSGKSRLELNSSLEFLAFFLEERPVISRQTYSRAYLDYVEKMSGTRPRTLSQGAAENWWGALAAPELERVLNSKLTSARFHQDAGWEPRIMLRPEEAGELPEGSWLFKDAGGMSGQGVRRLRKGTPVPAGPCVLEPLLDRLHDFSCYHFRDGHLITYENFVDERFQYEGTLFTDWTRPDVEHLSFYRELSAESWQAHERARASVIDYYQRLAGGPGDFSIDSFVYRSDSGPRIRHLSEVNWRRTMGSCAYLLARRYAAHSPWCKLKLHRPTAKRALPFEDLLQKLKPLEKEVMILSPGGTRFDLFLLRAPGVAEGEILSRELAALLART
jgi:hypothetical protein